MAQVWCSPSRRLLISFLVALTACRPPEKADHPAPSKAALNDSRALNATEDLILDALVSDTPAVIPNGDTLRNLGGGMIDEDMKYGINRHTRNSTHYFRIRRLLGNKPNGKAVWSTLARVMLPPMDSTEVLLIEGLCKTNGKSDRFIFGIVGTVGDSVDFHARRAWRFDLASETLREIPTVGVTCAHPYVED